MALKVSHIHQHIKHGYEVRTELHDNPDQAYPPIEMKSAYTKQGKYIGDPATAKILCVDNQIKPELITPEHNVCSIGFCENDQKWYGWSHRAIYGFQVGDVVKEGDCCASSGWTEEYLKTHKDDKILPVGFKAKTEEDCKKLAIAFASSVS